MLKSIKITRLRGIRDGELDEFTPLVVLVGPNGSGKSSILDSIYISTHQYPGEAILSAVKRHHYFEGARWFAWNAVVEGQSDVSVTTYDNIKRIMMLQYKRDTNSIRFSIAEGSSKLEGLINGDVRFGLPNNKKFDVPMKSISEVNFVELNAQDPTVPLHQLYSDATMLGRRQEAMSIAAQLIKGVKNIEILTDDGRPALFLVFEDRSVPVELAGDGTKSLLRLSLELATKKGGVVLLEEPEVHQHPGAIRQSARVIIAAVRRDIQVILTTHSLELIDALLAESKDDEEIERISVYRTQLDSGKLISNRVAGRDVAFARAQIGDDLR